MGRGCSDRVTGKAQGYKMEHVLGKYGRHVNKEDGGGTGKDESIWNTESKINSKK